MRHPLFVLLFVVALSTTAFADSRTELLIHALRKDASFKVRAKAAEILAKGNYSEAVPDLIESLATDENEIVRASVAAALSVLGPTSPQAQEALRALSTASTKDRSRLVRKEAEKAIELFSTPTVDNIFLVDGVYIELGKFSDTSKTKDASLLSKFQSLLSSNLAKSGTSTSSIPRGKKPLTLEGSIQKVEAKRSKTGTKLSLSLSITVTRQSSILGILQKQGAIDLGKTITPSEEASGKETVLEAIVEGLSNDIGKNISRWK